MEGECESVFVFLPDMLLACFCSKMAVCPCRKGTLVRATVLVFIGGALMGFSRACRMPAMVIIGRFITGLHSGRLISFLEELPCIRSDLQPRFQQSKPYNFLPFGINANTNDLQIKLIKTKP